MNKRLLQRFIQEALNEFKLRTNNVTLYHRSLKKFNVGDKLTPQVEATTGKHKKANRASEQLLEEFRTKKFPGLPSRLDCVFLSFTPHSRFVNYGNLYVVRPEGLTHVANSSIIDQLYEKEDIAQRRFWGQRTSMSKEAFERSIKAELKYEISLVEKYWNENSFVNDPNKANLPDLEVLAQSAVITEVHNDNSRIFTNDNVSIVSDIKIDAEILLSFEENEGWTSDCVKDNTHFRMKMSDILKSLSSEVGVVVKHIPTETELSDFEGIVRLRVELHEGFTCKIGRSSFTSPGYRSDERSHDSHVWSVFSNEGISLQIKDPKTFVKLFKAGKIQKVDKEDE